MLTRRFEVRSSIAHKDFVYHTWNSSVLGLLMWTAGMSLMSFLILVATSSLEHYNDQMSQYKAISHETWRVDHLPVQRSGPRWTQLEQYLLSTGLTVCSPATVDHEADNSSAHSTIEDVIHWLEFNVSEVIEQIVRTSQKKWWQHYNNMV